MGRQKIYTKVVDYIHRKKHSYEKGSFEVTALEVGKELGIHKSHKAISRAMLDDKLKPFEVIKIADKEDNFSSNTTIRYYLNQDWIIPANIKKYDYVSAFNKYGFVDWKQSHYKFKVGDYVYMYLSGEKQTIGYKTKVVKVNQLAKDTVDDHLFWKNQSIEKKAKEGRYIRLELIEEYNTKLLHLNYLLENGLKAAPQGAQKMSPQLKKYLENVLETRILEDVYLEGSLKKAVGNEYERNWKARQACLKFHGYDCTVCGFNFGERYGEIGKFYIHVHHLVPLSNISKEYEVDPIKDLVPVCPNCHAMLHQSNPPLTIQDLKNRIKNSTKNTNS